MRTKVILGLLVFVVAVIVFCATYVGPAPAPNPAASESVVQADQRAPATKALEDQLSETRETPWPRESGNGLFRTDDDRQKTPNPVDTMVQQTAPEPVVPPPVALAEPDPEMGFTQTQLDLLAAARKEFAKALGRQDPRDPDYLDRWEKARHESDDQLKVEIGSQLFMRLQDKSAGDEAEAARAQNTK